MVNWSTRKKIWLLTLLITLAPILLGFFQYAIIGYTSLFPAWDYIPLGRFFLIFTIIEFVIGYFMGDALVAEYRHRTQNLEGALPDHILKTRHIRRTPFWIATAIHLAICIICSFVFSF